VIICTAALAVINVLVYSFTYFTVIFLGRGLFYFLLASADMGLSLLIFLYGSIDDRYV
jgi:hypothetical protein